jgi:pimeloyl-ACP methyl ester carboxylesterase/DNA-binding SARP family transcriptional activator
MKKNITIKVAGVVTVEHGGQQIELPASRKSRALLGYLAITARPVRRERLCELFWDLPDDPRASLRWALSKLRKVLEGDNGIRIVADRERVSLDCSDIHVDIAHVTTQLHDDDSPITIDQLSDMLDAIEDPLLTGLETAGSEDFKIWLADEREDALRQKINILQRLTLHPDTTNADRVKWAKRLLLHAPYDVEAGSVLVAAYNATGRLAQADATQQKFRQALEERGLDLPSTFGQPKLKSDHRGPASLNQSNRRRWHMKSQDIHFCKSRDGVDIAYATVGSGPPLVKAANWLNHLELDWGSPIWGPSFLACAQGRQFIRYDERGNGLSDWQAPVLNQDVFVDDLETVVDAMGLDRFPLLGISQGCAVSIEYAARHPERVSGLILISGYATGWRIGASPEKIERREAVMTLTRHGWGTPNPAYRRIFSQTFMPDAKPEELEWFDEFQRLTTSPDNAVRFQDAFGDIDVRDSLAKVQAPTIVFHSKEDQRISIDQGRALADGIPNAEFVELESRNHILLRSEPAWEVCVEKAAEFLKTHGI